jgi:hypothetical protein
MKYPNKRTALGRLETLINRRSELDAAVRAEKEKQKQAEDKRQNRLDRHVGRALRAQAARDPEFQATLQTLLVRAIGNLDEKAQKFVRANYNMLSSAAKEAK